MKKIFKKIKFNAGMSYVELIVVLSIFAIMSSVILFNYQTFIEKVEVRKMTSLIALKVVEAQKNAIAGVLPAVSNISPSWKPSYGLYFNLINSNDKEFIYFADFNLSNNYEKFTDKSLEVINLGKGIFIDDILIYQNNTVTSLQSDKVSLVFTRPSSSMKVSVNGQVKSNIEMVQIVISSPSSNFIYNIEIQSSGRIQIKK